MSAVVFSPGQPLRSANGCFDGYYRNVAKWRDEMAPDLTDLQAWKGVLTRGSSEWDSFDRWWVRHWAASLARMEARRPRPWEELPPDRRALDPSEVPADVQAQLQTGRIGFNFGERWAGVGGYITYRTEIAWGAEAFGTQHLGGGWLTVSHMPGDGFEVWLMAEPNFDQAVAAIGTVPANLAAEMGKRNSDGGEQMLIARPLTDAHSIQDLTDALAEDKQLMEFELSSLDAWEREISQDTTVTVP
jgi:hypothetical protein